RGYLAAELGHVFEVLTAEESIELGLYGPPPPTAVARDRTGQLLLLPRENWIAKYQRPGWDRQATNIGKHGGLSTEEMLAPLLALRLG
ncbi:MAG: alkaline phosphatase family protein, partial [Chloroflexia bacterium]